MHVDAHIFARVCVSDQEGGRWRSVSPEGALRVGLRSEWEGTVKQEKDGGNQGGKLSVCVCLCEGSHS